MERKAIGEFEALRQRVSGKLTHYPTYYVPKIGDNLLFFKVILSRLS